MQRSSSSSSSKRINIPRQNTSPQPGPFSQSAVSDLTLSALWMAYIARSPGRVGYIKAASSLICLNLVKGESNELAVKLLLLLFFPSEQALLPPVT